MSDFIELYRIEIIHDYYRDACCRDINLVPTLECSRHMYNFELFLKREYKNRWLICTHKTDFGIERINSVIAIGDIKFDFYLEYTNPEFFLYTNWPGYKPHVQYLFSTTGVDTVKEQRLIQFGVTDTDKTIMCKIDNEQYKVNNSSIAMLRLNLAEDIFQLDDAKENSAVDVKVMFGSNKSHWEYVLIPRAFNNKQRVYLEEESGKLKFDDPDGHDMPDGQKSYVTMVKETINLREEYDYRINLFEEKNKAKRILLASVDYPAVTDFSDSNTSDNIRVVTKYIYF